MLTSDVLGTNVSAGGEKKYVNVNQGNLNPLAEPFVPSFLKNSVANDIAIKNQTMDPCDYSINSEEHTIPVPFNIATPDISFNTTNTHMEPSSGELDPLANPFIPMLVDLTLDTSSDASTSSLSSIGDISELEPLSIISELKKKNSERPVIAHLNINSLSSKFEPLTSLIQDNIDLLIVTESKLDETFPQGQFHIDGFSKPIRLDRNRHGGGIIIFIRNGLTCNELKPRTLYPDLECTLLELRIRQCKWLIVAGYNPEKKGYRLFPQKNK